MDVTSIYRGCDHDVAYHKAVDKDGTPVNNGICTWSLSTLKGDLLATGTVPYVAASDGEYFTTIDKSNFAGLRGRHLLTVALRAGELDDARTEEVFITNRPFAG